MKKQLLKSAVVAAIVLPMAAQAGVYGRADGVVRHVDNNLTGGTSTWDVGADKFRWGIVGSEDLGNGMKALYHYEFNLATNAQGNGSTADMENVRLANVGLEGGWGKVVIGRQWWPSYFTTFNKTDTADTHALGSDGGNFSGNRSGNLITYGSPDMNGFSVGGAILVDNDEATYQAEDGVDKWELTAQYKNGPIQVGAAYRDHSLGAAGCVGTACTDESAWGLSGSYSFGDLKLEGGYYNFENDTTNLEADAWNIGATYKMGANEIHGAYRAMDFETGVGSPDDEVTDWYIGFRHFMSKETRVFVEYRQFEDETGAVTNVDVNTFSFGLRKDWKL